MGDLEPLERGYGIGNGTKLDKRLMFLQPRAVFDDDVDEGEAILGEDVLEIVLGRVARNVAHMEHLRRRRRR